MSAAADAFFEEASPPKDMEWTPPRTQPDVSPQSPRPWFLLLAFVALGVAMRALSAVEIITGPSLLFGLGWTAILTGCAIGTLILARSRDAVTSRHVADAAMLGIAAGGFTWLFPHFNGIAVTALPERIGLVFVGASAGLLVGALIVLALARARTSVATVSFLVSCLLVLLGAFLFHDQNNTWIGLGLLIGAWTFAIAGWNDRAGGPRRRPPDSATLRSPRSMVSFATAACSAFAIRESFTRGVWADELPAILLLGLMFVAALVSVFDARRQLAGSPPAINNWSEWRASVETGVFEGDDEVAPTDEASADASVAPAATPTVDVVSASAAAVSPTEGPALAGVLPTVVRRGRNTDKDARVAPMTGAALTVVDQIIDDGPTDVGDPPTWAPTESALAFPPAGLHDLSGDPQPEPQPAGPARFIPVPTKTVTGPVAATDASRVPPRTTSELETFLAASAWTVDGELLGANAEFWEISQSEPSDGFNFLRIVHPDDRPALALQITRGTRTNLAFHTTVRLVDPSTMHETSRVERRVEIAGGAYQPATSPLGSVPNATYQVSVDTPQVVTVDDALTNFGLFDPLTGLGNAAYLEQWMAKRPTDDRRRTDRPLLIVLELADLGNYEKSEPRLRDVIMTEAAHALHSACRTGDFVVRLDGPYFAAVVERVVEGEEWYVLSRFEEIVKGTFTIAGRPFKIDGRLLPLRPNPGASLDDILDQVAALLVGNPAGAAPEHDDPGLPADADADTDPDTEDKDEDKDKNENENENDEGNDAVESGGASDETVFKPVTAAMKSPERAASSPLISRPPTIPVSPDAYALSGHAVPPGTEISNGTKTREHGTKTNENGTKTTENGTEADTDTALSARVEKNEG